MSLSHRILPLRVRLLLLISVLGNGDKLSSSYRQNGNVSDIFEKISSLPKAHEQKQEKWKIKTK